MKHASAAAARDATRRSGASCSASPAPAPTSPGSRRVRCATATSGSSTARRSGRRSPTSRKWGMLLVPHEPRRCRSTRGCRTSSSTCKQPGVEVRPLVQITGDAEFNEVFFDDVRVARLDAIGPEGDGWKVAITTLMNERVSLSGAGSIGGDAVGGSPLSAAARTPPWRHRPARPPALAQAYIESRLIRLNNERAAAKRKSGGEAGPEGSITKLMQAEFNQRLQKLAIDLEGIGGVAWEGEHALEGSASARPSHLARRRQRPWNAGARLPARPGQHDRRRDVRHHAQHPRRARPRTAQGSRRLARRGLEGRPPLLSRGAGAHCGADEPQAALVPPQPGRDARRDRTSRARRPAAALGIRQRADARPATVHRSKKCAASASFDVETASRLWRAARVSRSAG